MGKGGGYSKIIKICNSVSATFLVSFESLRIPHRKLGGAHLAFLGRPLHGVFHNLSLYNSFLKLCVQNG